MHRLSQMPGFEQRGARPDEIRAYRRALGPDQPIRPGMVSNPMAATNWRSVAHERLLRRMPDPLSCVATPSIADLPWALDYLLFQRRCNVLVINGGDGTIHHTLNAAIALVEEASRRIDAPVELPLMLFVNGGGMNMLARAFDTRGHPVRTLERFLDAAQLRSLGGLATRDVPVLAVHEDGRLARYGFIFGSELVLNALTMYERFGRGYRGLTRFFWAVTTGILFRTELWHRFGHLLDAPETPLEVDGVTAPRYTSVVAATAPMTLARGVVRTLARPSSPGTMNVIEVLETDKTRVIASIPRLMLGRPGPGLRYVRGAREVKVRGPYTLDGELVTRPRGGAEARIAVRATDRLVRGVLLEG